MLGETVLETTGEEALDETGRNKEPRAEIRSEEPEEATDNAQEEPNNKRKKKRKHRLLSKATPTKRAPRRKT